MNACNYSFSKMMPVLGRRRFPIIQIVVTVSTIWITILILIASDEKNYQEQEYIPLIIERKYGETKNESLSPLEAKKLYHLRLRATLEPNQERAAVRGFGDFLDFIDPGIIEDWTKPPKNARNKKRTIPTHPPQYTNVVEEDDMMEQPEIKVYKNDKPESIAEPENIPEDEPEPLLESKSETKLEPIPEPIEDYIQDPDETIQEKSNKPKSIVFSESSQAALQKPIEGAIAVPPNENDNKIAIDKAVNAIVDKVFEQQDADDEDDTVPSSNSSPQTLKNKNNQKVHKVVYSELGEVFEQKSSTKLKSFKSQDKTTNKILDVGKAVFAVLEEVFDKSGKNNAIVKPSKVLNITNVGKIETDKMIAPTPQNENRDEMQNLVNALKENVNENIKEIKSGNSSQVTIKTIPKKSFNSVTKN